MQAEIEIETKSGWKGTVTLTVPLNHIRSLELQKAKTSKLVTSKQMKAFETEEERDAAADRNVEILSNVYGFARKYVEKVDITGPEGRKCESLEAFDTNSELGEAWQSIAIKYAVGFGPGKTKSP